MKDASAVPATALTGKQDASPGPGRRRPRPSPVVQEEMELVRNMLSFAAASLPASTSASARLLDLQGVLRSDQLGHALVPAGLTRGMALGNSTVAWWELEAARWLRLAPQGTAAAVWLSDPLTGMPGHRARSRAADWTLRVAREHRLTKPAARSQLVAVALQAHLEPGAVEGAADAHQIAHRHTRLPTARRSPKARGTPGDLDWRPRSQPWRAVLEADCPLSPEPACLNLLIKLKGASPSQPAGNGRLHGSFRHSGLRSQEPASRDARPRTSGTGAGRGLEACATRPTGRLMSAIALRPLRSPASFSVRAAQVH